MGSRIGNATAPMKPITIRGLLNEAKWRGLAGETEVTYIDRGTPAGTATVRLDRVRELGTLFFFIGENTQIPYHRVVRITRGGEVVFQR